MQKVRYLGLLLLLSLLVIGCGGGQSAEPTTMVEAEPTATQLPKPTQTLPPPVVNTESVPTATPAPRSWDTSQFGYGAQSHAIIGDAGYTMDVLKNQLGLNWVKIQFRWADWERVQGNLDLGLWDWILGEADKQGLYVMLSVVTSPEWSRAAGDRHGPPDDYAHYYTMLETLLTRYPHKIHAIEVWNEQNLDREWQTKLGVDPVDYVTFLKGAYETIKRVDPSVVVISGALSPTGYHDEARIQYMNDFIWFDEAIALGMLEYADCVGVHHNGYNLPPDVGYDEVDKAGSADTFQFRGPWDNPHPSWSFKTTVNTMIEKAQAVSPDKKICVTEFGWGSSEGYSEYPSGFEFFLDNTLEEQAQYITQAFQIMRDSGDVMLAFLFNFDFGNKGSGATDDPVPYSILDINGVPRPAFSALSAMEKQP